ncbi:non-heme iron oxygenase ferredoxin subunit [Bordetella genomosp. 9]|uniref:Ferredoxin n=1 Tax=Bordetella genomosp. 9 TaxID=1416803 RepID=A0A1W6Z0Q8_9BORD|nr:non-heme iron oxygenase ferredoxin subunit [Bordetella genomosp. 9]ARP86774.1 ferredoxin [Bordetella genomosp. 9]ARP90764.1 ferredoxin [Bordetella genomosp. 9]
MKWIRIAPADALDNDEVMAVDAGGKQLALYRSEDAFFLSDNVCTHAYALLSDGYLEDGCIECPLHQARFDIRTGKALCAPATADIRVYPVKVEDGQVLADISG